MNEVIPKEPIPIQPIEQLEPETVRGGVEVKDDLIDSNNTYSSEKIEDRLDEVTSSLTQAIEDIDLSLYQLTSAKDTANGYMGIDANKKICQFDILDRLTKITYYEPFFHSPIAHGDLIATGSGSMSGGSNTPKIKNGNNSYLSRPIAQVSANSTGGSLLRLPHAGNLYSPFKVRTRYLISYDKVSVTTSNSIFAFLGAVTALATSDAITGDCLFFRRNPTLNSGNYQVCKQVSGVITVLENLSVTLLENNIDVLEIEYDKATEEAKFYQNGTLLGTYAGINLSNTADFAPSIGITSNDASEATIRRLAWYAYEIEVDIAS